MLVATSAPAQMLVGITNHTWKYFAVTDSDPGANWASRGYDDSLWLTGRGLFGQDTGYPYPFASAFDGPVNGGPVAAFFRTTFNWSGSPAGIVFTMTNYFDDGVVIYLNGKELTRYNMPAGYAGSTNLASMTLPPEPVVRVHQLLLSSLTNGNANPLVAGNNILAASVHNNVTTSSDTVFGLSLFASPPSAPCTDNRQPTNRTVFLGRSTTFTVVQPAGCGIPFPTLQWYRDVGFGKQLIVGQTNAALTLNSVGAADSGSYFVVARNTIGSVASVTASLAVLTDGANGSQPVQPVYPTLPPIEAGKDSLVFITHGRTPPGDPGVHPWVDDMKTAIKAQVAANWMVLGYKWVEESRDPFGTPLGSLAGVLSVIGNARDVGREAGKDIMELAQHTPNHKWEHVHLIAHSAGSRLIEEASKIIRAKSPSTTIHTTFLDAFTGATDNGGSQYGSASDWADSYFNVDVDTYDKAVGWTEGPLDHARNVDITWLDPNKVLIPILCPSVTAGSTSPILDQICSYEATSFHRWPYDFYYQTILGTASPCATGHGFPRSKEGSGWNSRASYPVGNTPTILCGSPPTLHNPSLLNLNQPFQISLLPNASSFSGVTLVGNAFTLISVSSSPAPQANANKVGSTILNGGPILAEATGNPVWLAVAVTVSNAVNFVQIDSTFSTTNAAEGLMTVYWNTNMIGKVDERVGKPTLETYRFGLPGSVTNGLYTLSFRLDVFANLTSTITVTNVATGFAGLDQPINLDMLRGSNSAPMLKLTGTSNVNYLVESSTNLLNWSPAALLSNTNGTVLFTDLGATNSSQRFYRATLP